MAASSDDTSAVSTPATTARSVRAATRCLAVYEQAPGLYLVDNGRQGDEHQQYTVEPDLPACTCADWEYRSDELGDDGCLPHFRDSVRNQLLFSTQP